MPTSRFPRRRTWLIALVLGALVAVVAGPWLYFNVLRDDPPARLSLDDVTTTTSSAGTTPVVPADGGIEGTWMVVAGSEAGYRATEVLFGQSGEAVGRTSEISGVLTIDGPTVTAVDVSVLMGTVTSDESRRDGQFRGRIMDTATYPTATFSLTAPIELGVVPADGVDTTYTATGDLTLRGVKRSVTFELTARRTATSITASASIPIDFDDFDIPDASGGPASVGRDGELELLLVLGR